MVTDCDKVFYPPDTCRKHKKLGVVVDEMVQQKDSFGFIDR
jgi:hypothetical protein